MAEAPRKLAAIDIGTNSIHLLLVQIDGRSGKFKVIGRAKEPVRLGAGSPDLKHLSEAVMAAGIEAISKFKAMADAAKAPLRAVATSAVREALNQAEFIRRVQAQTGVRVEVASGFEEARLTYLGVMQALPVFAKRVLLIDIGGGSTEFLVGDRGQILFDNSLKLGAVRLSQRFFPTGKIERGAVTQCRDYVAGTVFPVVRELQRASYDVAVGSSGTIQAMARMIRGMRRESTTGMTNAFVIQRAELKKVVGAITKARTVAERRRLPGLDPGRADIVIAGALIVEQIFAELGLRELTVSDFALREGIIVDSIEKSRRRGRPDHEGDIRWQSVLHLAEHYQYERGHAAQVAKLALSIFDQTASLHRLDAVAREYLEAAAVLHEVGGYISHARHHQHSYYLIKHAELLGFTENEIDVIANVARYHRKSHPKMTHDGYARLNPEEQLLVRKLAGILRIADGLDRTHSGVVSAVTCRILKGSVHFSLQHRRNASVHLEEWAAGMKRQLFEETYRTRAVFGSQT
ncbi:Ppx/GppA family phosphatase [candidate division KSB1 bacterium]|nr:Ppx/GppA family phosphatase [candidate division KSB1 bacterium]